MALPRRPRRLVRRGRGRDEPAARCLLALTALTWLPFVLTLTLFIAVLMTLSRAYRDSEMVVWLTTGQSLLAWVGPVVRFAWPIVIAIALLAFFVSPWSQAQIEMSRDRFARRDDVSRVAPGRFIESGAADRVFFVESVDMTGGEVRNVFVSSKSKGRETLVVAENGVIEVAPNGDRFIVLQQGRRYEGAPGQLEYRTLEFDRYAIRLESRPDQPIGERRAKTMTTLQLLAQPFTARRRHWQIAAAPCVRGRIRNKVNPPSLRDPAELKKNRSSTCHSVTASRLFFIGCKLDILFLSDRCRPIGRLITPLSERMTP